MHPSRPDPTTYDEHRFVTALARGLDLLRAFRPGEILLGYLRFDEVLGKYDALDAGVLSLGHALLAGTGELEVARPHMQALAREIGAAVSLGCRDGLEMIYLETIRSESAGGRGRACAGRLRERGLLLFVPRLARRRQRGGRALPRTARAVPADPQLQWAGFVDGGEVFRRRIGPKLGALAQRLGEPG